MVEGEEISQRTFMNDSWTQTTVWGWSVETGWGSVDKDKGRKLGQQNRINKNSKNK